MGFLVHCLVPLLAAYLVYAQMDPLSGHTQLLPTANLFVNITIDLFVLNSAGFPFATNNAVFKFSNYTVLLPIKSSITDDSLGALNSTQSFTQFTPTCSQQTWTATGQTSLTLALPALNSSLFQFSDYADLVTYVTLQKPLFSMLVEFWATPKGSTTNCVFNAATDSLYETSTFTLLRTCYTQDFACTYYNGNNYNNYLYTDTMTSYGFQVEPLWDMSGTRVTADVSSTQFIDMQNVTQEAMFGAVTATSIPPFEWGTISVASGGAIHFYINAGYLQV
jgi:hypothetical protein